MTAPDFPPEAIEKAARMAHCPWCVAEPTEPCQEWAEPVKHLHPDRLSAARAVLAAVADDLRAEGYAEADAKHTAIFEAWQQAEYQAHHEPCKGRYETLRQKWQNAEADLRAARAELAEVKAELEAACDNAEEARQAQAHWHEQALNAERRGAVAALREAADVLEAREAGKEWKHGELWVKAHAHCADLLRARADRIEGGES